MTKIQASAATQIAPPSLADALELVEARLDERLRSEEPRLGEIAAYLVRSGGKRVRPTVTIVVFRACGGTDLGDIVDVAAALELIHSATLLHDDIIDHSDTRRGRDSAYRRYGLADTLVTGDFVFSRAFELCARFEEKLIRWAAQACVKLTEGEVMQARFRRNVKVTVDDYRTIIYRKTASIFEQGARTAAYLAGAPQATVDAMARCGADIGMTFQIVDDLLDVEGDSERTGKPVGIDLREGNPSLPIVLAIQRTAEVRRVFEASSPSEVEVEQALDAIRASGVLDEVRAMALDYGHRARSAIAALAPSSDREHLLEVVDQLLRRVS